MTIEQVPSKFVIRKGKQYFSFFVDHDRTSWSDKQSNARTFSSEEEARTAVSDINRRDANRKGQKRS